jgi:ubiquinone/menaquinone biosynthesis C-methylase UbiE
MTAADTGSQLKQNLKNMWMAGDFGKIAEHSAKEAERFVARLNIVPGSKVLDVACGTGNLAIPAARVGAQVTGLDIAPNLLEQARERAAKEKLQVRFDEGDAEQLPYATEEFDVVMSMFGAMFAPDPDATAREMLRVCCSGGRIAMANWTPDGFVAKMFQVSAKHAPPPAGLASPLLWGNEEVVRERFGVGAEKIDMVTRSVEFRYPFSPKETVQFFRKNFGPTATNFARLEAAGQNALAADLERMWAENNEAEGDETVVPIQYLEVVVTKA